MTPTALSIISATFPDGLERNKAPGIWGMNGGFGARGVVDRPPARRRTRLGVDLLINISVGLAALALSPVLVRESRARDETELRHRRAVTITAALVLLVYAVVEAPEAAGGTRRRSAWSPARRAPRCLRADRVAPPRAARAAQHLPLADASRARIS